MIEEDLNDFYEKHCAFCGTQCCTGVFDESHRGGCPFFINEFGYQ